MILILDLLFKRRRLKLGAGSRLKNFFFFNQNDKITIRPSPLRGIPIQSGDEAIFDNGRDFQKKIALSHSPKISPKLRAMTSESIFTSAQNQQEFHPTIPYSISAPGCCTCWFSANGQPYQRQQRVWHFWLFFPVWCLPVCF